MNAERSCHRKKRYWTQAYAEAQARKCTEKRGTPLRAYLCEFCLGWHLTKQVDGKAA